VPGLRVGYALAPAPLADKLRAVRPPWSANSIALAILEAAPEHPATLQSCAARAGRDGADLDVRLRGLGLVRTWPSATNYRLVEVPNGPAVVSALHDQSIAVRPAGSFPGLTDNYLRMTARDAASNQRLVDALKEALR
jgi:histidinol-phosphate aminotransferase